MKSAAAISLLLFASSAAFADEPAAKSQERAVEFQLRPYLNYTFNADIKTGGGKTDVFRGGSNFDLNIPIGQRGTFDISFNAEYSKYHFEDATGFGIGGAKPISNTYEYELNLNYSRQIDDHWSFFVVGGVNASGEHGADFGDSLTYGGGGGVSYKIDDSFTVGFAAIVRSRLEEDAYVVPLPLITWKINEQWEFTSRYIYGKLVYKPCDQWQLFATVEYISHEYRLDEDAGASKGIFRDRAIPVSLGATCSPTKSFSISAGAGVNVWRQFTLDDQDGNRIARTKTDPSLGLFVNAVITF